MSPRAERHRPTSLADAVATTRTGDIWVFRGSSPADRAIQTMTNSPVNHVGMAVVIEDLPPMMWHAELGRSLLDLWSGDHHRGVQLHDLEAAVRRWQEVYGQRAWLRQLTPGIRTEQEDSLLRCIARMDGMSFPSTGRLAWRWLKGRDGYLPRRRRPDEPTAQAVYCAEVVAMTMEEMGILEGGLPANWYDPGRFWSGDELPLRPGWRLGTEIAVAGAPR